MRKNITKIIGDWFQGKQDEALDRRDEPAQYAKAIGLGLLEGVFLGCAVIGVCGTVGDFCKLITNLKK